MSKDLIIGAIDLYLDWSIVAPWAISAREHHTGDIAVLTYRTSDEIRTNLQKLAIDVYQVEFDDAGNPMDSNSNTRVHSLRFFHMWQLLLTDRDKYDYIIATDVKDVVFQSSPSEFIRSHHLLDERPLLASSESIKYCDEGWGEHNMKNGFGQYWWEEVKNSAIYNVGVVAGTQDAFTKLCSELYIMTQNRFHPCDQSAYNLLVNCIHPEWFNKVDHDIAWACQAGTTLDEGKRYYFDKLRAPRPKILYDKAYTSDNETFCIFHQYDRTSVKSIIDAKYA